MEVVTASTRKGKCTGMKGTVVEAILSLDEVNSSYFDAIIAVGGAGALNFLSANKTLINLFLKFKKEGKIVSAIGRARHALYNAGLFGTNFTWGSAAEIHDNVIAARPPSTTPGWTSRKFGNLLLSYLSKYEH